MICCRWIQRPNSYWLLLLPWMTVVNADHYPGHATLEWGIGMATIHTPDYRGSNETYSELLPLPYIKYRGERLRIDEGIEGRLFKTPDLLLAISGNGSLPSSEDNRAREGMDELDASIELGPSLEYRLQHDARTEIWLELPLRFAYSVNSELESIGHTFNPRLAWRKPARDKYDWKLNLTTGLLYADQDYHNYFYQVSSDEVTADRPLYDAGSGYSGLRLDFTYSKRIQRWWLGGFIRYDDISDSEFESSPLVTDSSNWLAGFGLAWIISEN
ncbi:MAG: MipA/OmpV family protein [Gammaproteobacteria bacterium]|nr:MipA/OmpV family protein [Gammaproteobacteria bacterium]